MKNWIGLAVIIAFVGCKSNESKTKSKIEANKGEITYVKTDAKDSILFDNGVKIHWMKRGSGEKIKNEDLVEIEYKVFLADGKLIEGSHMFGSTFPFMVGFEMQTKGWDFVMCQLKIGDEIEAFIPSRLARGEKGIEGMIPPNSDNILYIKAVEKRKPSKLIDGVKIYTIAQNKKNKTTFNNENTIVFHTMVSSASNPVYYNSFRENKPFTLRMRDAGVVPGLKKALKNSKKADRLYVVVPPKEAYGNRGLSDLVAPNESIFYNLYVVDVF